MREGFSGVAAGALIRIDTVRRAYCLEYGVAEFLISRLNETDSTQMSRSRVRTLTGVALVPGRGAPLLRTAMRTRRRDGEGGAIGCDASYRWISWRRSVTTPTEPCGVSCVTRAARLCCWTKSSMTWSTCGIWIGAIRQRVGFE